MKQGPDFKTRRTPIDGVPAGAGGARLPLAIAFSDPGDVLSLFTNHAKLRDMASFNQALCGMYAAGHGFWMDDPGRPHRSGEVS